MSGFSGKHKYFFFYRKLVLLSKLKKSWCFGWGICLESLLGRLNQHLSQTMRWYNTFLVHNFFLSWSASISNFNDFFPEKCNKFFRIRLGLKVHQETPVYTTTLPRLKTLYLYYRNAYDHQSLQFFDLPWRAFAGTCDKLTPLYIHYHNAYDHQTSRSGGLP